MLSYKCVSSIDKDTALGEGDRIPCDRIRHSDILVMIVNVYAPTWRAT